MRRFARLFTREAMLASDWYRERLAVKQERDVALWKRHVAALESGRFGGGGCQRRAGASREGECAVLSG